MSGLSHARHQGPRLRPHSWCARAQSQERRRRYPARRPGRVHRGVRIGQVLSGLLHPLCGGAAPLSGIGLALCPSPVSPDGDARGRSDRGSAAGGGSAAAAGLADHPLVCRQRHNPLQPSANALFARRRLSARAAASRSRILLAQYAGRRLSAMPWPGPDPRGDRSVDGARPFEDHPRTRRRRLAAGLGRPEPARHPDQPRD